PEVLETLKEIFSKAEVFVIYGCSEISCMGCTYPVPRDRVVTKTYVGRPFDNVIVRVLDAGLNPVPVGVVGQIHFAGGGVVKGYLNRPELTVEKFIQVGGRRFYCTGDLGRLSEDGWLEILGRNDFQIKIRGMRIELAEVEHNLRRAPGVVDGVVMARDAADGEKSLVAYVVLDRSLSERPSTAAIRRHMVEQVPDYMVPSAYVELESLPLNHNMKVDRHSLPEAERASRRLIAIPVRAPETPTEKRLALLWENILEVEGVGVDENFFELGGHSMLAMALLDGIKRELGVSVQGLDVLRESLEVLAAICDRQLGNAGPRAAPRGPAISADTAETFHFGPENSLYGVFYPGAGDRAALLCSPTGPEHVRTHFILTRLARLLALQGVSVLRFDYYGCADSLGESIEASCDRWQRDITDAFAELRRRTNAASVTGIGVRLGATLLASAAKELAFSRLVFWDPVGAGSQLYAEMAEMHRKYLRSMQDLRMGERPEDIRGGEQLLGTSYSDAALRELKTLRLDSIAPATKVEWLVTSQNARQKSLYESVVGAREDCHLVTIDFDSCWDDAGRLDDILPDVGIAKALAAMVRA
ncbi:MAG: AMP-binding protein, partial [Polyangiaceae bacterium]